MQTHPSLHEAIPHKVAADFVSAVNCFAIREHKAAATMFRRSLQQVMIDKSATGSTLEKQIDNRAANNIINAEIRDWAHQIRLWGNEGAHPSKDGLDELSQEELQEVTEFLEQLFEYVYVMPAKLAASKLNHAARKQVPNGHVAK